MPYAWKGGCSATGVPTFNYSQTIQLNHFPLNMGRLSAKEKSVDINQEPSHVPVLHFPHRHTLTIIAVEYLGHSQKERKHPSFSFDLHFLCSETTRTFYHLPDRLGQLDIYSCIVLDKCDNRFLCCHIHGHFSFDNDYCVYPVEMGPLKPPMKKQVTIDEAANTVSVPRSLAKPPGSLDLAMKPLKPSMDLSMKPMDLSMVAELVPNGRLSHCLLSLDTVKSCRQVSAQSLQVQHFPGVPRGGCRRFDLGL